LFLNQSIAQLNCIFAGMEFSSKLLEKAVNEMSQLPGIGKRTALRLVLHLLNNPKSKLFFYRRH
jgi:recombination protein RecR